MPDFDANEGYIDRRARRVDASAHADAPEPGRRTGMTSCHDRLHGSPS
jgi:hypothetical protein